MFKLSSILKNENIQYFQGKKLKTGAEKKQPKESLQGNVC